MIAFYDLHETDEQLVQKYLATQEQYYFSELYDRYSKKVYGKCISFFQQESEALDVTHDVFMKVMLRLSKFRYHSKFSTWLYSLTYNHCIDVLRKRSRRRTDYVEDFNTVPMPDQDDWDMDREETGPTVECIDIVFSKMHADDKAVLMMKYIDGMSIKEISAAIGKSDSAIKMKIMRAKEKFRLLYYDQQTN